MRGILFAALGGICWGFSGTCAQLLTSGYGIPVAWITCVRLLLSAAIFLVVCLFKNWRSLRAVLRDKRSLVRIAAFAILGVLLTQVSYLSAIAYTNAGTGTVFERLGLVLIMLVICLRARRLPRRREFFGLALALAGTVLIATKGNFGELSIPVEGLFWGLIAAVALVFYTLIPGKALAKWGSFIVTGLSMFIAGTLSTLVVRPWTIPVEVTPHVALVMAAMVLIGTFAAYLFYLQGISDAGPMRAGLVGCVEPVSATIISALWLGTPVAAIDIVGMALILSMVFMVTQPEDKSEELDSGLEAFVGDLPPFEGRASLLGYYQTRPAHHNDFVRFKEVLDDGHASMKSLGIDETAGKKYPSERRVMRAIDKADAYVVTLSGSLEGESEKNEQIIGVFSVDLEGDKAYAPSSGVHWLTESPAPPLATTYAALHWVTVAREAQRRGVGMYIMGEAERIAKEAGKISLRCDVYDDNGPMKQLLIAYGFSACGSISVRDRLGRERERAIFERVW